MRTFLSVLLTGSALLLGGNAAATPLAARTACGSITVQLGGNDFSYRIKVVSGQATCATARTVARGFIARKITPRGWFCARGHSRDAWAASCARVSPKALVRAYLIAG